MVSICRREFCSETNKIYIMRNRRYRTRTIAREDNYPSGLKTIKNVALVFGIEQFWNNYSSYEINTRSSENWISASFTNLNDSLTRVYTAKENFLSKSSTETTWTTLLRCRSNFIEMWETRGSSFLHTTRILHYEREITENKETLKKASIQKYQ